LVASFGTQHAVIYARSRVGPAPRTGETCNNFTDKVFVAGAAS
jgi:hypothetical protein